MSFTFSPDSDLVKAILRDELPKSYPILYILKFNSLEEKFLE